ncbi:MAG: hypothetical protein KJ907_07725 [Actinobacteria bacterium]|nr:hypothetical protein [Actinomycetota bacterium]MBU4393048.1 hypothetical protein [Actinomycetota bacterium]MBU4402606.1 hypothetical protein [Actinomycetota bacterium]MBU4442467.1 hypothetical protein [Actinomycetota bacterium]
MFSRSGARPAAVIPSRKVTGNRYPGGEAALLVLSCLVEMVGIARGT